MKTREYRITAVVLLVVFPLCLGRCMGAVKNRFHSEMNGYSFTIPDGWTQVPDDILRQTLDKSPSGDVKQRLLSQYEVAFQLEAAGRRLQCPYVLVEAIKYSEDGFLNGQPNEDDFDHIAKDVANKLSGAFDKKKRLYEFKSEMQVANVGKVKIQTVGHFGRYATVQLMFYDSESNWSQSKAARDLIVGSFQFDPAMAYDEASVRPSGPGFWERRAMEALPVIVLVLIVGSIGAIWGLGQSILKRRRQGKDTGG